MRVHLLVRLNLSRNFLQFPHLNNDHLLSKSFKGFGVLRLTVGNKFDVYEPLVSWKLLQKQEELVHEKPPSIHKYRIEASLNDHSQIFFTSNLITISIEATSSFSNQIGSFVCAPTSSIR